MLKLICWSWSHRSSSKAVVLLILVGNAEPFVKAV
jgi:hypothetical protein